MRKYNQAIAKFSKLAGKKDESLLINICNWIQTKYYITALREPFLIFGRESGQLMGFHLGDCPRYDKSIKVLHPDIFIYELKTIVEVDGNPQTKRNIHKINVTKTQERDQTYKDGGLKVIRLDVNDLAEEKKDIYKELEARLEPI